MRPDHAAVLITIFIETDFFNNLSLVKPIVCFIIGALITESLFETAVQN